MIKERLIECYRGHGFDVITACEMAAQWLADLRKEPVGTEWKLGPNLRGESVTVRKD